MSMLVSVSAPTAASNKRRTKETSGNNNCPWHPSPVVVLALYECVFASGSCGALLNLLRIIEPPTADENCSSRGNKNVRSTLAQDLDLDPANVAATDYEACRQSPVILDSVPSLLAELVRDVAAVQSSVNTSDGDGIDDTTNTTVIASTTKHVNIDDKDGGKEKEEEEEEVFPLSFTISSSCCGTGSNVGRSCIGTSVENKKTQISVLWSNKRISVEGSE